MTGSASTLRCQAIMGQWYQRRDWVSEERLVEIRCYSVFSEVKLPIVELPLQVLRHSLRQGDRFPTTCRLLAPLKTKLTRIPSICLVLPHTFLIHLVHLVAFSYTRLFLVVVLQQRHVKNVTNNIGGSIASRFLMAKSMLKTS